MELSVIKSMNTCILVVICYLNINIISAGSLKDNYEKVRGVRSCNSSSVRCESGECIPEENLCDGTVHCKDGSDETKDCINIIPCASKLLFQCDYGACINKDQQCDGKRDCRDNSDETETACRKCGIRKFKCASGECIHESLLCDGLADCSDGSDETVHECRNVYCPEPFFRCKYGACIKKMLDCNGINDCFDGSDEDHCINTTTISPFIGNREFRCSSGECIKEENICDGIGHCRDYSDETTSLCSSMNCAPRHFRCKYGACVRGTSRCNGMIDCVDASDEAGCYVDQTYITTIQKPKCLRYEFKCNSEECIPETDICNGRKDCDDGSDETYEYCSSRRCPFQTFTCEYGGCIPNSKRCNDIVDCWDGSDEIGCAPVIQGNTNDPLPSITSTTKPLPTKTDIGSCIMPNHPKNGVYQSPSNKGSFNPGYEVLPFTVLVTKCNEGYVPTSISESAISVCFTGSWVPSLFKCKRTCPSLISSGYTECIFENKPLKSCQNAIDGTVAVTRCANSDEGTSAPNSKLQVCRNGVWNNIALNHDFSNTNLNSTVINIFYISQDKER